MVPVKVSRGCGDPHALSFEIARNLSETPQNRHRALGEKLIVVAVEVAQQPNQQFEARMDFAGLDAQRGGDVREFRRHFRLVHIHADSDDGVMNAVGLRVHFRQDAAEFLPRTSKSLGQRISGVASSSSAAASRAASPATSVRSGACAGGIGGRNRIVQLDSRGLFRNPLAPGAAAAGGLFLCEHDGAVRLACFAEVHGDGVRRIDFEKVIDAPRERRAVQAVAQELRRQNVGHALDVIARVRMAFHAHAELRSFSIQRQTCCRVTPISLAIFAPLMTIVAFSASSVSSASMRRSVAPGRLVVGFFAIASSEAYLSGGAATSRASWIETKSPLNWQCSKGGNRMAVLAIFTYEVKPGRTKDFMAKLHEAASPKFNSKVMPKSVRLFRNTVPGPDTGPVILVIEYEDMAAYGARTAFENANPEWKQLFASKPDSPETLVSVQLVTEMTP